MLAGQVGFIALRDNKGDWSISASIGVASPFLGYLELLLSRVPEQDNPNNFGLSEINQIVKQITRMASFGLLTGVGLPLIVHQRVIGVIIIFRNYSGVFSANDQTLLQSFADQAAIAVYNARLYTQIDKERQKLNSILDSAADGILIIAPDHRIERVNPAFVRMIGIPADALLGRRHEDVIMFSKKNEGMTLEEAESGGWPLVPNALLNVEGDLKCPSCIPLPVEITYAPLMNAEGTLINIIATIRDITRFREADELKTTFISVISHELKTPVALIKGYVSTLRREDADWDPIIIKDSLTVIEEEADHLTELIENLLDASRLQAGALSMNLTDLALAGLIERVAQKFQTQTTQHQIVVDLPPNFPVIMADENRINQLLSNLVSNAIKYSPEGGEIRISGQNRPDQVIVCVSDEGSGIPSEDIPFVFDRFYRANSTKRTTKGAGLGLYLARAIVEAHRGHIWVDPKTEKGTRICFSLPKELKQK
jgi:signal transduction histidine kinase